MRRLVPLLLLLLLLAGTALARTNVDALLKRLASPDARQRAEAVEALGEVPGDTARDAILRGLVGMLDDPHPEIRRNAALVLARRGDRRGADAIARRLQREGRVDVLPGLLLALGDLGDARHVEAVVVRARAGGRSDVRAAALSALGRLGGERARKVLLGALEAPGLPDVNWSLRAAALLGLARVAKPEDVGRVHVLYREGAGAAHWFARSAFARFVAARDPDPVPQLLRLAGDRDPRVAVTAAVGLARSGHTEALLPLLAHVVPKVRAAAVSAVAQAKVEAAYPRVRALAHFDRSREVRWASALALFRVEDPEGDVLVLEGVGAKEPAVWAAALGALVERTGERHGRDVEAWRAALVRWRRRR